MFIRIQLQGRRLNFVAYGDSMIVFILYPSNHKALKLYFSGEGSWKICRYTRFEKLFWDVEICS